MRSSRPTLTVAMIVRDEARHLARALASVRELADEIVVVDTGSIDESREIARRHGARVIDAPWEDDFAAARNVSLEAATGDWILILDADEEIDYLNAARLERAIFLAPPAARGFVLTVVSQAEHPGSGVEVLCRGARLFRNRLGIRFAGELHEQPVIDGRPLGSELRPLEVAIYHFGYADPLKNQTRAARNLGILRRAAARRPGDPELEFHLAGAAVTAGHHAEAAELYRGLLRRGLHPALEVQVRWNLALARLVAGDPEGAECEIGEAVARDPERASTRFLRAQILVACKRAGEALAEVRRLQAGAYRRGAGPAEVSAGPAALNALAAECQRALGDLEGARASLAAAAAADRSFRTAEFEARLRARPARPAAPAGPRPAISAALIVRDEEAMLPGCLASLAGAVDEVVVVDTGSHDATHEVAARAGARVIDAPWKDDFAAARNISLEAATGDWVLVIDADERLEPGAAARIRELAARADADAALVTVRSITPDREPLAALSARSIRLFRRLPGVRFSGLVHEQIRPALERLGLAIVDSPIGIEHLGYAQPPAVLRQKHERNLELLRRELERRGGLLDGLLALHLGMTLEALGQDREALAPLAFAVTPAAGLGHDLLGHAQARLAQAHLRLGDPDAASRHVREALAIAPEDPYTRYVEAGCLHAAGEPAAAAAALRRLAERAAPAGVGLHPGPFFLDLGDVAAAAGDLEGAARAYAEAARHLAPGDLRPASRLRALGSAGTDGEAPAAAA